MADSLTDFVTIREPISGASRDVPRGALPFFVNQGFEVLTSDGRKNTAATNAATTTTTKGN